MSERSIRVGLAQILVEGGRAEENLNRAVDSIGRAAARECRLVVLPECLDLGWTDPSDNAAGRTLDQDALAGPKVRVVEQSHAKWAKSLRAGRQTARDARN
jgi:predicted amidohydrolase